MNKKIEIKKKIEIDYTDWYEDVSRKEMFIANEDDLFELVDEGKKTSDLAIAAIVSRAEGEVEEEIISPNKSLLLSGGMFAISKRIKRKKELIIAKSGEQYEVSTYIGEGTIKIKQDNGEEDIENYQKAHGDLGMKTAERYILKTIPQHIWSHLKVIYMNGGDVEGVLEQLKDKIDELKFKLLD